LTASVPLQVRARLDPGVPIADVGYPGTENAATPHSPSFNPVRSVDWKATASKRSRTNANLRCPDILISFDPASFDRTLSHHL